MNAPAEQMSKNMGTPKSSGVIKGLVKQRAAIWPKPKPSVMEQTLANVAPKYMAMKNKMAVPPKATPKVAGTQVLRATAKWPMHPIHPMQPTPPTNPPPFFC